MIVNRRRLLIPVPLPVAALGKHDPVVPYQFGETEFLCTLVERFDDRGKPVYIVMRAGVELTSRWTRGDADRELERRNISK